MHAASSTLLSWLGQRVKSYCKEHKTFTLKETERLVPTGFAEVTAHMRKNFRVHVTAVEDNDLEFGDDSDSDNNSDAVSDDELDREV